MASLAGPGAGSGNRENEGGNGDNPLHVAAHTGKKEFRAHAARVSTSNPSWLLRQHTSSTPALDAALSTGPGGGVGDGGGKDGGDVLTSGPSEEVAGSREQCSERTRQRERVPSVAVGGEGSSAAPRKQDGLKEKKEEEDRNEDEQRPPTARGNNGKDGDDHEDNGGDGGNENALERVLDLARKRASMRAPTERGDNGRDSDNHNDNGGDGDDAEEVRLRQSQRTLELKPGRATLVRICAIPIEIPSLQPRPRQPPEDLTALSAPPHLVHDIDEALAIDAEAALVSSDEDTSDANGDAYTLGMRHGGESLYEHSLYRPSLYGRAEGASGATVSALTATTVPTPSLVHDTDEALVIAAETALISSDEDSSDANGDADTLGLRHGDEPCYGGAEGASGATVSALTVLTVPTPYRETRWPQQWNCNRDKERRFVEVSLVAFTVVSLAMLVTVLVFGLNGDG